MKCDRCQTDIPPGQGFGHSGQNLCEDCYMDALSPVRACDPWAVYTAKSYERHAGHALTLSPIQSEILDILKETGGLEPPALLKRFEGRLTARDLEREFAILRHMEKARGEKQGDRVVLKLW